MDTEEIEFFLHGAGHKPKVVKGRSDERLQDVLVREGAMGKAESDVHVFLGECDDALHEADDVEDGADDHEPADHVRTLHDLGLGRHHHVHVHRCRLIAVEVHFADKTKRRRFSPATTIAVVTDWARHRLPIDDASATEFVLQVCGTKNQPRPGTHLGELAKAPDCALCFNLVKQVTPQG